MVFIFFVIALWSYFLGSFPAGYIAGRLAGIDIRTRGSGNIGATNVLRTLGKKRGYAVFLVDVLKGYIAVWTSILLSRHFTSTTIAADWAGILAALACVCGHAFPIWLKFKGGKGVATSGGAMFALAPLATLVALLTWVIVFEISRYVSVASISAALVLPAAIGICLMVHYAGSIPIFCFAIVLALIVCWRHRSNFARLARGDEPRFNRR